MQRKIFQRRVQLSLPSPSQVLSLGKSLSRPIITLFVVMWQREIWGGAIESPPPISNHRRSLSTHPLCGHVVVTAVAAAAVVVVVVVVVGFRFFRSVLEAKVQ